jgi:hypothetical protein
MVAGRALARRTVESQTDSALRLLHIDATDGSAGAFQQLACEPGGGPRRSGAQGIVAEPGVVEHEARELGASTSCNLQSSKLQSTGKAPSECRAVQVDLDDRSRWFEAHLIR